MLCDIMTAKLGHLLATEVTARAAQIKDFHHRFWCICVLRLDVHMHSAHILLGIVTVRALEESVGALDVGECHLGC